VSQGFTAKVVRTALALAFLGISAACRPSQNAKQTGTVTAQPAPVKRYLLTGHVVSVDKPNQSLNIDGDEIPGFMAAMKMPYPVKDASILRRVSPGDQIKAEILVGNDGAYLENVVVATKAQPSTK
jgi:protein SCO1/2